MSKSWANAGIVSTPLVIAALLVPTGASAGESTDFSQVRNRLSTEIPEMMRASHAVGVTIALVDGKHTVWARGFGMANRAKKVPVTAETLFQIGSTSKTMAAVAVMQLVEQGKVDLDAPLSRYVPQFKMLPRFSGPSKVTVRSVLDMHSGIPGDIENGIATTKPFKGFDSKLLGILAKDYPQLPVDTVDAYCNSGYVLLRDVVEHVTDQNFAAYTAQNVFAPMGMHSTTFDPASAPTGKLSVGYVTHTGANGGVRVEAPPRVYVNGWAGGSGLSSATEMASYLKTLLAGGSTPDGGRILSRSTLQEMTTPQTHLPLDVGPAKMGLGWFVGDASNMWMGPALHWNGGTDTFRTFFRWLPKSQLGVFVSVNTASTTSLSDEIGLRALGLMVTAKTGRTAPEPAPPSPVVKASPAKLQRAIGRYASTAAGLLSITASGGNLKLEIIGTQVPNGPPITLQPRADGWYAAAHPGGEGLFETGWYKPATLAGRHVLLIHSYEGAGPAPNGYVALGGERLPSNYRIPAAWRDRVGTYDTTNYVKSTPVGPGVPRTGELSIEHGVLTWNGLIVSARDSGPAFTIGFPARTSGEAIVPSGETLTVLGVTFRKVAGA
jgi:CubicO group peptidase (beta-lactamase class C family)